MTAAPRVLLAVGGETLALRLRLMLEAEGADVVLLGAESPGPLALAVAAPMLAGQVRADHPGVPVIELAGDEDWEALRRQLAAALAPPQPEADRLSAALAPPLSEADRLSAGLAAARILLVDDSVTYREFLRHSLTRMGASVTVCGNGGDALAYLAGGGWAEGGWDCVLVDLVMPGVDGAELCGRIARLRRDGGRDHVLAVLSSRESKDDLVRSLDAGADLFLGKSQDMAVIRATLGALLRRRALRR